MSAANPRAHDPSPAPNKTLAFTQALLSELARAGVAHVCICPGSRSAPLAIAARSVAGLTSWIHLDERAAAFFALGLAKASRRPVALLCTSGTAAANFLPAVIEAHYAQVPLVVLTADRPPELRDWGAGQTIDQLKLFGSHLRWFADAGLPEASESSLRYARALACRAAASAQGPTPGPVHLNIPMREPLDPTPVPEDRIAELNPTALRGRADAPYTASHPGRLLPSEAQIDRLAEQLAHIECGILACGPSEDPELPAAMTRLAQAAGWPILADVAAQLRFGAHAAKAPLICHAELFLRDSHFATATAPEFVLRFGATPTSKHFQLWLERHPATPLTIVDPSPRWDDPSHLASEILRCDPTEFCLALANRLESNSVTRSRRSSTSWLSTWLEVDRCSKEIIADEIASGDRLLEPAIGVELTDLLPSGTQLYLSSSMPIRDLDNFAPPSTNSLRVLCNRGANGIDGVTSSALGASAALKAAGNPARTILLTGDLAFLHDLGGLLAAKRYELDATIIVLNNDGGGIFSFLPVSNFPEQAHFDELFTTSHGLGFEYAAKLFGLGYAKAETMPAFRTQLEKLLDCPGTNLLELIVDREGSVALHRRITNKISEAVSNRAIAGAKTP